LLNVAPPLLVVAAMVLPELKGPAPVAETEMLAVLVVTRFPNESCTWTWTAGLIPVPAVVLPGCTEKASLLAAAGLITMLDDVPFFPPAEFTVTVMVSATLSLVLIVNVPLLSVLVLSPKAPSPLLSNCTPPVPVVVTTVELSVVTVLLNASLAATVTLNALPAVCGELALTV
jgi:hypothetical protein